MKEETCADGDGQRSILVEYMYLDLASLDSVRRFCSTIRDRDQSLDILINNAGISWAHYGGYRLLLQVLCVLRSVLCTSRIDRRRA